jgi:hypothetical protein
MVYWNENNAEREGRRKTLHEDHSLDISRLVWVGNNENEMFLPTFTVPDKIKGSFRFDYEYDYEYEIRQAKRMLYAYAIPY